MNKSIDLSHIYNLRNNFTIIGLTGQIGSGCSEVAEQLSRGFQYNDFEDPLEVGLEYSNLPKIVHNEFRKYRIVYNYAKYKNNFKGYTRINFKDVLMFFILQNKFEEFIEFLQSTHLKTELIDAKLNTNFDIEVEKIKELKSKFYVLSEKCNAIIKKKNKGQDLYDFYFNSEFLSFSQSIHNVLKENSQLKRNKLLQIISTNLRKSGRPFDFSEPSEDNIFIIVKLINDIISSCKNTSKDKQTQIVIDDLRSPIEIMYFKQQYAAFYLIAVTKDDVPRKKALKAKYNKTYDDFDTGIKLWEEEYLGGKDHEFYKTKISACIQQADIHISFVTKEEAITKNKEIREINLSNKINNNSLHNTSPCYSWKMQLLKYVSLIRHPGLITPSPEERCMQLAFTAKHNSGCISRQVGAAITDENYSIKSIGWNNTPTGQVPCVLRNSEDLLENKNDITSFTDYETKIFKEGKPTEFFNALYENFASKIKMNQENLMGRNVCFCFKDIKNSYSEGKNQVHTRSLHAEENAFLQITKYGGGGIENGKLFTTASPCEQCAKKAYQLGIKVIYYIDPYPGISDEHILSAGSQPINPRLFNGVIGKAYHWLYDPIMPFKDELTLLLGNKFDDYATKQKKRADKYYNENIFLNKRINELTLEKEELNQKLINENNA